MKKLIIIVIIGVIALVVISVYAMNHPKTVIRYIHPTNQEQLHALQLLEEYSYYAECDETQWIDLMPLDDSIWNYICSIPHSDSIFNQPFCDYIATEEYKIDSACGWTDHYALTYRLANNIHYWRFNAHN